MLEGLSATQDLFLVRECYKKRYKETERFINKTVLYTYLCISIYLSTSICTSNFNYKNVFKTESFRINEHNKSRMVGSILNTIRMSQMFKKKLRTSLVQLLQLNMLLYFIVIILNTVVFEYL